MTSCTPDRPRAASPRKNASQPAPSSAVATSRPRISRLPSGVDAGRDQGVHVHRPAALADLLGQGVDPHERVRPGVQRPGPELATISSSSAAITLTCDFDSFVTPSDSASFSTRRVETPSR